MCKVAAETVFEEFSSGKRQLVQGSRPMVRISDVQKGSRDMFTSIVLKAVSCSTDYEALLLISLGALKRGQDDRSFQVKEILTKIESIANASGELRYMDARLSFADVIGMVHRLGDVRVSTMLASFHCAPFVRLISLIVIPSPFSAPPGGSYTTEYVHEFTFSVYFDASSFVRNPCLLQRHKTQQTCGEALGKSKTLLDNYIALFRSKVLV